MQEGSMDFVDHRKISHSGGTCCHCGKSISTLSKEYRLCDDCLEKRRASEEALRQDVRKSFNLVRSPGIRSCFFKLLLSQRVELEPSGWRKSMALGYELKDAGFSARESVQILIQAGAKAKPAIKLLETVYGDEKSDSLHCHQIKRLDVACQDCPQQFRVESRVSTTEIFEGPSP
jgi:hypothetical protein